MTLRTALTIAWVAVAMAGCDGPLSLVQRLEGDWVGRPETTAERIAHDWPTGAPAEGEPADPELAAAIRDAPSTDLEAVGPVAVSMRLSPRGVAELSLDGAAPRVGSWSVEAGEGRRALLDLVTRPETDSDAPPERRKFLVEFFGGASDADRGFVLREQGADLRFGRLLFTPADAE